MAIERDIEVRVIENRANTNSKLYYFLGDRGITLNFTILDFNHKFNNYENLIKVMSEYNSKPKYSDVILVKPSGESCLSERELIINNKIRFTITKDLTDELTEVGEHKLQIRVYDQEMNRLTIPHISFHVEGIITSLEETLMTRKILTEEGLFLKTNNDLGIEVE